MTNSSKNNRFFLCFRPVVDLDVMLDSSVPSHRPPAAASHTHEIHDAHNSVPPKRKLSRVIKAMFFETLLNRRARRQNRYRRDSCESDSSYSTTYTEETSSTGDDRSIWSQASVEAPGIQEMNSESRLSLSSPSDSKFLSKSKSCPSEAKHRKRNRRDTLEKKRNKLDFSGIYMLLLCLILTVFWGKIVGTVLTSIWLYSYSAFKKRCQRRKTERKDYSKNRNHRKAPRKGINEFDGKLKQ